jgi:hypothetical protein
MTCLNPKTAQELKRRLGAGDALLADIRKPHEHAREPILAARPAPRSSGASDLA